MRRPFESKSDSSERSFFIQTLLCCHCHQEFYDFLFWSRKHSTQKYNKAPPFTELAVATQYLVKNPFFRSSKYARCLKITEKVSLNIASEASYVYILSGQKFIKNGKKGPFWRVFENLKLAVKQCYQTGQF